MLDIFGDPNWADLARGVFGDVIRGLLEGLNWILLVLPFSLAAATASHLETKKAPKWIVVPAAMLVCAMLFVLYYLCYPYIEFPYWMRWIPR